MISNQVSPLWRLTTKKLDPIVLLGGEGDRTPFYCVHSISGDVTSLQLLARELASDRRVYGIQIPKKLMNAEFATSVRSIAQYYVDTLVAFQPDGPIFLGGWSAGSFIALEMAQLLMQRGRDVALLVALDGFLYGSKVGPRAWHLQYYWQFARNLPNWIANMAANPKLGRSVGKSIVKRFKRLTALMAVTDATHSAGSNVDKFLDTSGWPEQQAVFVRILFNTVERYEPQHYCGSTLVYSAKAQHLFRSGQVRNQWKKIADSIEVVDVNGTHVTMIQEPHVFLLAKHLRTRFAEIDLSRERQATGAAPNPNSANRLDNKSGLSSCLTLAQQL